VINGLTDYEHPCQVLADLYTLRERLGRLAGHTIAYVGDANNVARSLAVGCGKMGMSLAVASPAGYQFDKAFLARLHREVPMADLRITEEPATAAKDAVAVYTDVWASMGQEAEAAERRNVFARYQVDRALMAQASPDAVFMHWPACPSR
jgi:ornithine carbamoyltransferase